MEDKDLDKGVKKPQGHSGHLAFSMGRPGHFDEAALL